MANMCDPIPSAGETTIIGLPAITMPVTSTGDRPLTKEDLDTIMRLSDGTALLISTGERFQFALSARRDEITVGRDPRVRTFCWMTPRFRVPMPCSAGSIALFRH